MVSELVSNPSVHVSVLFSEVMDALQVTEGGKFLDCTTGGAGHLLGMLSASKDSVVFGIDRDRFALKRAEAKLESFGQRAQLRHLAFSELVELKEEAPFDGILADLGLSSDQLAEERGLSFRAEDTLDMRMNDQDSLTAAEVVNQYSPGQLTKILGRGGVRKHLKRYVGAILDNRPFHNAKQLGDLIVEYTPMRDRRDKHPATVVFQAIRMEVNNEIAEIEALLDAVPQLVAKDGVFACISFHSLEDKLVTKKMRKWRGSSAPANWAGPAIGESDSLGKLITSKAIVPTDEEVVKNPRSRSARLRVFRFERENR